MDKYTFRSPFLLPRKKSSTSWISASPSPISSMHLKSSKTSKGIHADGSRVDQDVPTMSPVKRHRRKFFFLKTIKNNLLRSRLNLHAGHFLRMIISGLASGIQTDLMAQASKGPGTAKKGICPAKQSTETAEWTAHQAFVSQHGSS